MNKGTLIVNGINYSGVSFDGASVITDVLFETSTYSDNITLSSSYENYDFIMIEGYADVGENTYLHTNIYDTKQLAIGNNIGLNNDAKFTWYNIDSTTNFSKVAGGDIKCNKVLGIKTSSDRCHENAYSLDEVRIGSFLGKPLYRKMIPFPVSLSNDMNVSSYIPDDLLIMVNSFAVRFNLSDRTMTCNTPTTIWYADSRWKLKGVDTMTYITGSSQYLILEYTKVSDL